MTEASDVNDVEPVLNDGTENGPDTGKELSEDNAKDSTLLTGLCILPPKQKVNSSHHGLLLPPLRAEEPVQSLRAALSEVVGFAQITNFRFELEEKVSNGKAEQTKTNDNLISPYTRKDAVVMVPVQVKSLDPSTTGNAVSSDATVLDEYGDLSPLLEKGLKDGSGFRMVLERYDSAAVKDHISRLRSLFEGNAPTVISLVEEVDAEEVKEDDPPEGSEAAKAQLPPLPLPSSLTSKFDEKNLADFFYLACGEDPSYFDDHQISLESGKGKNKKNKKSKATEETNDIGKENHQQIRDLISRWNELEESTRIPYKIHFSGFHPPPPQRRLMGDIAYLLIESLNSAKSEEVIHVTATTMGFYVNKSKISKEKVTFDPAPLPDSCYSHTLLDCLLQTSSQLRESWKSCLDAAKERTDVIQKLNGCSCVPLFPVSCRGDFKGFKSPSSALQCSSQALDASLISPSWLVPVPRNVESSQDVWDLNAFHGFNSNKVEDEIRNTFGVDVRNGAIRDWNEELQLAREMPVEQLNERIERARLIHKVMTEFGEASLLGVKAIFEGQIAPMNPNEATRSQVYLHNNIFFSRAVDAGPETFKIAKGDKAAKKSANRDVQCIGTFHKIENSGLYTLATVLIDYLGTRFVCQSILPGILIGEKSHTLLYGSVEAGIPLKWNEELHKILEEKIGEGMMVASRPVFRMPLTNERMEEIKELKKASPLYAENEKKIEEAQQGVDPDSVVSTCVPIEAKCILGSDHRKYILDFGRLTPRDANWVPKENGGTGKFDLLNKENGSTSKANLKCDDDEWTMCVLRPELVTRYTQVTMARSIQSMRQKEIDEKAAKESEGDKTTESVPVETKEKETPAEGTKVENEEGDLVAEPEDDLSNLSEEKLTLLKNMRLNLNVFLPNVRQFDGVNEEAAALVKSDEQLVREIAIFMWDEILPKITKAVRDGTIHQLPVDGKTLTEFLHRNGVNCRYLGHLGTLAKAQEEKDLKTETDLKKGQLTVIERRTMPKCWLELVECEIVARSAKHVLDHYLTENGGVAAAQPAQTIASFLSALISESEETAAQTEARLEKNGSSEPDDEDYSSLTLCDVGGGGDAVPTPGRGRQEIWKDIEAEAARRFRYSLSLYNNGNKSGRALYIPLLRRICQRSGIRLVAKKYDVGGKCLCSAGGGRLTASFPISPLDVYDVVPLMKHSAAYSEGFTPCSVGSSIGLPSLQVSLQDARLTLERAHIETSTRALGRGLELAQEAASLYQRVTENAAHPGVIECMELMAAIFLEAGDPVLAAANGAKALSLTIQNSGFDSSGTFNAHMSLFQMYFAAKEMDRSVKHLRAAIYLLEIMCGPHHIEHFTAYHKLGSTYSHPDYEGKYLSIALEFFKEASTRDSCDRLMEGIMAKNFAKALSGLENYKDALEYESKAFRTLSMFLGKDHQLTKDSETELKSFARLAIEKGNKVEETDNMREKAEKAEAIAADLVAEEEHKLLNSKKKKKGKK